MNCWAIIPAAGTGERFGGDKPKPLADLDGKPVIALTLAAWQACADVQGVVLVVHPGWIEAYRDVVAAHGLDKVKAVVSGGKTRTESVRLGMLKVGADADVLIVHDGARPLLPAEVIQRGLLAVRATGAATAGVLVKPTIKAVDPLTHVVRETLDRSMLWEIQTPQIFTRALLQRAHDMMCQDASDDAALVERLGIDVVVFDGAYTNIKITTPEDMLTAQAFLRAGKG